MRRYALTIAYDGTDFNGWQKQARDAVDESARALRSVQHTLEQAVISTLHQHVSLIGASRTDSGVHAVAQVAAFNTTRDRYGPAGDRIARALNSRLPDDIVVLDCRPAHLDFHPVFHCISKGYRYRVFASHDRPLWNRHIVHRVYDALDINAMQQAAALIEGTHDFAAFASARHRRLSTVRSVHGCTVSREDESIIAIDVSGDGFLYNMVRIIVGTLIEVGKGRKTLDQVRAALECGDRRIAGPTAPAQGLCLMWTKYPEEAFDPSAPFIPAQRKPWEELLAREQAEAEE